MRVFQIVIKGVVSLSASFNTQALD